jgi:NitT/TauT family transport system substrate-binding protein
MSRLSSIVFGLLALLSTAGCREAVAQTQTTPPHRDRVRLQLKWVPQAQFAGYFAAETEGFFERENIDVTFLPGGVTPSTEEVVARGDAEVGIDWLPSLLSERQHGRRLVNIAQVFQHSAMREIAWRASGIHSVDDLRGHRVGVWGGGSQYELLATLARHGIDPQRDVRLFEVQVPGQGIDMFLAHQLDATGAMTYNEYRRVLDSGVRADELTVIDFNAEGTAMLEDGLFVREDWLRDRRNEDLAVRFVRATLRGWEFCRDHAEQCVEITMRQDPRLDRARQAWMMTEVNRLIWGSPAPALGSMQPAAFRRTADIALRFGITSRRAEADAFTTKIWERARRP